MDRNPREDEELIERRKDEGSSSSGAKPSFQYHETPSASAGVFGFPWEAERGSIGFMDLLGIQDYASAPSAAYSLLDLIQPSLPPPLEQPARPTLLPSAASTAPEPSEVVNNQTSTPANSSSLSPSSDEGQTNKAAEEGEEEEKEEEESSNNQERTKKQ